MYNKKDDFSVNQKFDPDFKDKTQTSRQKNFWVEFMMNI